MRSISSCALFLTLLAGIASAQVNVNSLPVVNVSSDIAVSTTWTAGFRYNLTTQVYVLPGATLTIEAGTNVISNVQTNGGGSLAVTRGAKIFVNGTAENPVIMSSDLDLATWTNGDRRTGTWRPAVQEWGNLTICGNGYISENAIATNTATPNASNFAIMEGLTEAFPGDTRVRYGGGNDDDCSGAIRYVSIRYAGRVIGLGNELNGLSLGGIGRRTDICFVDIMNNVDDGIEIWGGTVNIKNASIWNIGDDSFDIDQGYRGKAQFVFIVQGYGATSIANAQGQPTTATQGSGVGDNMFEVDGAEDSNFQPQTTMVVYNATAIGEPNRGDHGTAWRDNANVQYRNCIFQDTGENLVHFDNVDGDGAQGYGFGGTLSWLARWSTASGVGVTDPVNAPAIPADFYRAQVNGNLCEMSNTTFANIRPLGGATDGLNNANGYNAVGANGAAFNNQNLGLGASAVRSLTRAAGINIGSLTGIRRVTLIDPRPTAAVAATTAPAPQDGELVNANFRGAFDPNKPAWVLGWTAADNFGFIDRGTAATGPGQPSRANLAVFDATNARNLNGNFVGTTGDLNGPFYSVICKGETLTLSFQGEPNRGILLFAGSILNPGVVSGSVFAQNLVGQIDVGTFNPLLFPPADLTFVANGVAPATILDAAFRTDAFGNFSLSLQSNFVPGSVFNLQAAIQNSNPLTNIGITNAIQVTVY